MSGGRCVGLSSEVVSGLVVSGLSGRVWSCLVPPPVFRCSFPGGSAEPRYQVDLKEEGAVQSSPACVALGT